MKPLADVLYDSEVSLRMVARAMQEFDIPDQDRPALAAALRCELHAAIDLLPIQDVDGPEVDQIALVLFDLHQRLTRIARDSIRRPATPAFKRTLHLADTR